MASKARKSAQQHRKRLHKDRQQPLRRKRQLRSTKPEDLPLYEYLPLDEDSGEIRLIRLLPGRFDDEIRAEIVHAQLVEPEPVPDDRPSLIEMRKTLPSPWAVGRTLSGDYIYHNLEEGQSQYWHPVLDEEGIPGNWCAPDPYPTVGISYDALSYCWGTDEPTCAIRIVSRNTEARALYVRPNLYSALQNLRLRKEVRVLWIDAIAINQVDWRERSHEVGRMSLIYKLAASVVVWLGPVDSDNLNTRAIEILDSIGSHVVLIEPGGLICAPGSISVRQFIDLGPHDGLDLPLGHPATFYNQPYIPPWEEDLVPLRHLLELPWWTRLWVWQEVILPKSSKVTLQTGPSKMSWDNARGAITLLSILAHEWPQNCTFNRVFTKTLLQARRKLCAVRPEENPLTLIGETTHAMYTMPHDRMYALLGLLHPGFVELIRVDYTIPVDLVAQSFCLAIADRYRSLQFLAHCDLRDGKGDIGKPTWVPEFFVVPRFTRFNVKLSMLFVHEVPYVLDNQELIVYGVSCGSVDHTTEAAPTSGDLRPVLRRWEKVARRCGKDSRGRTWKERFVETIQCGEITENCPTTFPHKDLLKCLRRYEDKEKPLLISDNIRGRSYFTIKGASKVGGICSPSVRKGDIVAAILGANDLIILRAAPTTTAPPRYKVVGPAYVPELVISDVLFGPLPAGVTRRRTLSDNRALIEFVDANSGTSSYDDPRLGSVPRGWGFGREFQPDEPVNRWFKHKVTGEVRWGDPRTAVEKLRKRGTALKKLRLI